MNMNYDKNPEYDIQLQKQITSVYLFYNPIKRKPVLSLFNAIWRWKDENMLCCSSVKQDMFYKG